MSKGVTKISIFPRHGYFVSTFPLDIPLISVHINSEHIN